LIRISGRGFCSKHGFIYTGHEIDDNEMAYRFAKLGSERPFLFFLFLSVFFLFFFSSSFLRCYNFVL
jgi:hypothetical protein